MRRTHSAAAAVRRDQLTRLIRHLPLNMRALAAAAVRVTDGSGPAPRGGPANASATDDNADNNTRQAVVSLHRPRATHTARHMPRPDKMSTTSSSAGGVWVLCHDSTGHRLGSRLEDPGFELLIFRFHCPAAAAPSAAASLTEPPMTATTAPTLTQRRRR
ncbi:hypothetical protein MRX96_011616 [Rhipicephalus microplus]